MAKPLALDRVVRGLALASLLATASLAALASHPATASAHLGSTKYLVAEPSPDGVRVDVAIDAVDASVERGLGEEPDLPRLLAEARAIGAWLAEGIHVRGEGGACTGTPREVATATRDGRPYLELAIDYVCPAPARGLVLRDDTVFPDDPQHEAFVRLRFATGPEGARILRRGGREAELGAPSSAWALSLEFLREGVLHLVTGYDHVLFLLSLLLPAGLVAARDGGRKAVRDVAFIVTAFTLGHSLTLGVATLGLVVLPSAPVEIAIAASIMFVAAWAIARPETRGPIPWLALAFGLVHGFGFSSVLAEQGLPRGRQVLALASFNVGIELAQLAVVAVLLGPLAWLGHGRAYRPVVVRGGSAAILAVAAYWLVERVFAVL